MNIGFAIGLIIGITLFWAIRIAVEDTIWRLRGRPCCGLKPPMKLSNLWPNRPGQPYH